MLPYDPASEIVFNQTSKCLLGSFEANAVIISATGDLDNLRGTIRLQGTVDLNGIATVT